jgi:ketosteroid isomerase-like protein
MFVKDSRRYGGSGGSEDDDGDQGAEPRCRGWRGILNHDAVQLWLDAYVDAWRTYDPAAIGALFAEDATYAYHPYDEGEEVVRGREAIVADWLEEQDEPGTWEASYRPLVVEGQRAVAEGTTSYTNGDFFWNLWTLRFDDENRCVKFVEWFMVRPQD